MSRLPKRSVLFLIFAVIALAASQGLVSSVTYAEEMLASPPLDVQAKTAAEVIAYWTSDRMAEAAANPCPMPIVEASLEKDSTDFMQVQPVGKPGLARGTLPVSKSGSLTIDDSWVGADPQYTPPGNWSTSYPGPFQRWTWFGRYLTYPTSTIGKLFFTQNGINYVCSASVIYAGPGERDVIATAGHCVSDGNGHWSTNLLFCPSYNKNGVNPVSGCWPAENGGTLCSTFSAWHSNGAIEADVAGVIAANTGTIVNDHVGNFTGTLGRAWNWGADEPEFSFGYPAGSPFPGYHIIAVAGPEWYTYDWGGVDLDGSSLADSKYMGNDMTGGCSGGPWILGWGHHTYEYPDTDASNSTDPLPSGGGWLNGVNSHKIVVGGVTRSQEMGSVQFTTSHPDTEGLWSHCQGLADTY